MEDLKRFVTILNKKQKLSYKFYEKLIWNTAIPNHIKSKIKKVWKQQLSKQLLSQPKQLSKQKQYGGEPCPITVNLDKLIGSGSYGSVYKFKRASEGSSIVDGILAKVFIQGKTSEGEQKEILERIVDIYDVIGKEAADYTTFTKYSDCLLLKTISPNQNGYFLKQCYGTLTKLFSHFHRMSEKYYNKADMPSIYHILLNYQRRALEDCYHRIYSLNSKGVIHGDIKNENILFTEENIDPDAPTIYNYFIHDFDGASIYPNAPTVTMCTPMTTHPLYVKYCKGKLMVLNEGKRVLNTIPNCILDFILGILNQRQLIQQVSPNFIDIYDQVFKCVEEECAEIANQRGFSDKVADIGGAQATFISHMRGKTKYLNYLLNLDTKQLEVHLKYMDLYSLALTVLWTHEIYTKSRTYTDLIANLYLCGNGLLRTYLNLPFSQVGSIDLNNFITMDDPDNDQNGGYVFKRSQIRERKAKEKKIAAIFKAISHREMITKRKLPNYDEITMQRYKGEMQFRTDLEIEWEKLSSISGKFNFTSNNYTYTFEYKGNDIKWSDPITLPEPNTGNVDLYKQWLDSWKKLP